MLKKVIKFREYNVTVSFDSEQVELNSIIVKSNRFTSLIKVSFVKQTIVFLLNLYWLSAYMHYQLTKSVKNCFLSNLLC
jgi:hypothetical protein